jgi:raffinose/stachyose/melibiose transport system substrate-binding protein
MEDSMKSRATALLGATVVAAIALSSCSSTTSPAATGSSSAGDVSGVLKVEYDASFKSALEPVVAEFKTRYPNATINIDYVGADILNVVSTQAQAGTLPDIFLTVPGPAGGGGFTVGTLGSQGYLADLSGTEWAAKIPDTWKPAVSFQGKVYAYPGTLQGLGAIYNTTLLQKLNLKIPGTWTELLQLCSDASKAGVYAFSQGLNDGTSAQMPYIDLAGSLAYGPNPDFLTQMRAKKVVFKDSPWKDVFTKYKQMGDAGCFGKGALGRDRTQSVQEVAAGHALAVVDVGAQLGTLKTQGPSNDYTLVPLPATDDASKTYFSAAPGYTIAVSATSKNPTAAKAFLSILSEPKFINTYSAAFSGIPAIPNTEFVAPASLKALSEGLSGGKSTNYSDQGWAGEVGTTAQTEIQKLILGQHSVDQLLDALQAVYNG